MAQTHHLSRAAYDRLQAEHDDLTTRGRVENAEIVEADGNDQVSHGSVVSIRYAGDDEVERYLIGSIEERHDDLDVISPSSPLGEALIGSTPGDSVTFTAPTGAALQVEVVGVD